MAPPYFHRYFGTNSVHAVEEPLQNKELSPSSFLRDVSNTIEDSTENEPDMMEVSFLLECEFDIILLKTVFIQFILMIDLQKKPCRRSETLHSS